MPANGKRRYISAAGLGYIRAVVIPRVFHQVWLGANPLPDEFKEYQGTWREHHPEWELRLWTEETLPPDLERREVYEVERSPAERADILRLELLARHGGVYLDTDLECVKPIDELVAGVDFFTAYLKPTRVNNAVFGSVSGHPILQRALATLRPQEIGEKFDKTASGALFFDSVIKKSKEDIAIFPPHFFYPSTPQERRDAYAIHHAARSWKTDEEWRQTALKAEQRLDGTREELEETRKALEVLEQQVALGERGRPLRILFFLRSIHYDRVLENFMREVLARGHEMHVALALEKRGLGEDKTRMFDEFRWRYAFSYERLEPRKDQWTALAVALRHGLDYLRYLEPEFAHAEPLRERARQRAPFLVRTVMAVPPLRARAMRRLTRGVLRALEAPIPLPKSTTSLIESFKPDVVLVSPLVGLGSIETDHVRAAHEACVPTVLVVASWDNLTNKGILRDIPTMTIVWNETQVDEAVRLHKVSASQVAAVGAHSFDHWFTWQPSTTREEFAARMGLDPGRPLIVYLGSSGFIAGDETPFVAEWLGQVRRHPRLQDAAVIMRPHPQNSRGWQELHLDEPGRAVVWPKKGTAPTDDEKKREYFDTLYHANAIVGINTTALIEASILDRPVFTLVSENFATQEGTLHFSYIAEDGGGPVKVGRSWNEHLDQIADAIASRGGSDTRAAFVERFVRPLGLDTPAAPAAADAVERAATRPAPSRRAAYVRPLYVLLTPLVPLFVLFLQPRRTVRGWMKAVRGWRKRFQKWLKGRRREAKRAKPTPALPPAPTISSKESLVDELTALEVVTGDRTPDKALRGTNGHEPLRPPARGTGELGRLMEELDRKEYRERTREGRKAERERERGRGRAAVDTGLPDPRGADRLSTLERQVAEIQVALEKMNNVLGNLQKAQAQDVSARTARRRRAPARRRPLAPRASKRARGAAKSARRRWKYTKRGVRAFYNRRWRFTYRRTIVRVPSRDEIPVLLNVRGLRGQGVEIGVKTGKYSEQLLRAWRGERLLSIDPWISADPDDYVDRSNVSQDEFEKYYEETKKRLARFGPRSEIWRLTSLEAAARIPDQSLDFAYIDARHDYDSVLQDLEAWFPKVRPGGILAGHDYADGVFAQGDFGVKSAVDEFFGKLGIPVHGTQGPSSVEMFPSWIVEIPADAQVPARERPAAQALVS